VAAVMAAAAAVGQLRKIGNNSIAIKNLRKPAQVLYCKVLIIVL
jgi:hypothetical protein